LEKSPGDVISEGQEEKVQLTIKTEGNVIKKGKIKQSLLPAKKLHPFRPNGWGTGDRTKLYLDIVCVVKEEEKETFEVDQRDISANNT